MVQRAEHMLCKWGGEGAQIQSPMPYGSLSTTGRDPWALPLQAQNQNQTPKLTAMLRNLLVTRIG